MDLRHKTSPLQLGMSMYVRIKRQRQTIFLHCESMLRLPSTIRDPCRWRPELQTPTHLKSTFTSLLPLSAQHRCVGRLNCCVLRADVRFFFVLLILVVCALGFVYVVFAGEPGDTILSLKKKVKAITDVEVDSNRYTHVHIHTLYIHHFRPADVQACSLGPCSLIIDHNASALAMLSPPLID